MDVKYDFSDVDAIIAEFRQREVKGKIDDIGKEAVEYAKENGTYQNRTGRLRASNKYDATEEMLTLYNDAPYAGNVEAKGYDVLGNAALFAEKRLKDIFE